MGRRLGRTSTVDTAHAVVIGAGVAGLFAARVLEDHFDRVTVVERDPCPNRPGPRPGVPHRLHIHLLTTRGLKIAEQFFTGLDAELGAAGAVAGDIGWDLAILLSTGWMPRFTSGFSGRACSRQLLESCLYRRIAIRPKIQIASGKRAIGLLTDASGNMVRGVRIASAGGTTELSADLVVDASGRNSPTPDWLCELGFPRPPETIVDSSMGYCSRRYQRPAKAKHDWLGLMIFARPPTVPGSGVLYPEEEDRWGVALAGAAPDTPPGDEVGFLEFAGRLASPVLHNAIKEAVPLSPIMQYRRTENRLRHYERAARWPERFVVLGDAVCASNPIYGQGMTLAALGALTLRDCLDSAARNHGLTGLSRHFQRKLAQINRMPWLLATSEDLRYPATIARPPMRVAGAVRWYVDRFVVAAPRSRAVGEALIKVINLIDPYALVRPGILVRVLTDALNISSSDPQPIDFEGDPASQ